MEMINDLPTNVITSHEEDSESNLGLSRGSAGNHSDMDAAA